MSQRKLIVPLFQSAEYVSNRWVVTAEPGTTIDEIKDPIFWANVANRLRQWDRIEVRDAAGEWVAELVVLAVEPFAAKVHVVRHDVFDMKANGGVPEAQPVPEGYEVKNRGKDGWCVIRQEDKAILKTGEVSRAHALIWLQGHLKALS